MDVLLELEKARKELEAARLQVEDAAKAKELSQKKTNAIKASIEKDEHVKDYQKAKRELDQASKALVEELSKHEETTREGNVAGISSSNCNTDSSKKKHETSDFKVLLNIFNKGQMLNVEWEFIGDTHNQQQASDYIGLYKADELNTDEYYNIETDLGEENKGSFSMRLPVRSGNYVFRYITDNARRCAGISQYIFVNKDANQVVIGFPNNPVPYFLLKDPNLLCYWLYLPLQVLKGQPKVDLSSSKLPARVITLNPNCQIPTMTIDRESKSRLTVLAPRKCLQMTNGVEMNDAASDSYEHYLVPYLEVVLDEQVDLDRSTMSFHGGDFLACRLSFANASSAAAARRTRQLIHPSPEELILQAYQNGISCKTCFHKLVKEIAKLNQATVTPWEEILHHLICVPRSEYIQEGTTDAFSGLEAVKPKAGGTIVVDESFIVLEKQDVENISPCSELDEPSVDPLSKKQEEKTQLFVACATCKSWLGFEQLKTGRIVLFKHCIQSGENNENIFEFYNNNPVGTLIGNTIKKLSEIREQRKTSVYSPKKKASIEINIWSSDSWMKSHTMKHNEEMYPVMKVTFLLHKNIINNGEPNPQIIVTENQFDNILDHLNKTNAFLPPSARKFGELSIGFIVW